MLRTRLRLWRAAGAKETIKKQGKPGLCCAGPTTISAGYKSAYYTCPKGYKTQLLQTLIDYTIKVPILLEQKIDLELYKKQVDDLMQAYDLE